MGRAYGPGVVSDLRGAVIGSAAWVLTAVLAATGAVELTLIDVLLVLAPLVVVPVGLVVAGRTDDRAVTLLRLGGAALTVPALLAGRGGGAGVLALPWLAVAMSLAVPAASTWLRRPDFGPPG
jgi:hypothetical protein